MKTLSATPFSSISKKNLVFALSLVALCIVFALYWVGLSGPFLLDDLQSIEPTQMDNFTWTQLLEISLQNNTGPLGRPLSIATFALNNYFFALNPFYFKLVNLIIHLICTCTVALFVYLLIMLTPRKRQDALIISFICALIFAVHPLQVSTVLYPVQRMTQLSALFTLIGLNTYLLGRIRLNCHLPYALFLMCVSLGLFFPLAILSKETGILFPWYLFAIEYFILRFRCQNAKNEYILVHFHRLLSLSVLLAGVAYYWYRYSFFQAIYSEKNQILLDRILTQIKALAFYIKLILMPNISKMGLYHDDFVISTNLDKQVIFSGILLLAALIGIFLFRRKAPIFAFGLSWFFISHAIESTILPLEMVFEHRNYLAIVGLILIPVYYGIEFIKKSHAKGNRAFKRFCILFFSVLIALLMSLTYLRSYAWSSTEKFLTEANRDHPMSPRVHIETANWFLNKNEYALAIQQLELAQLFAPHNAGIALHELLIFCRMNSVPEILYTNAQNKMKIGTVSPYVIIVLETMIQNMFNKQCASMNKNKIREIIQAGLQNPLLSNNPRYRAILYHFAAGLEMLENNLPQSRSLLLKSFETYPKRLDALIQKANIEIQNNMLEAAQQTVDMIHQHASLLNSSKSKIAKLDNALRLLKEKKHPISNHQSSKTTME